MARILSCTSLKRRRCAKEGSPGPGIALYLFLPFKKGEKPRKGVGPVCAACFSRLQRLPGVKAPPGLPRSF